MKFLVVVLGAMAVLASATAATPSAAVSAPASTSTTESILQKCLDACKADDVVCRAKCVGVPSPNPQQVNETEACVEKCPQGHGSAADIKKYTECRDSCIGQFFYTSGGTPAATSAALAGTAAAATGTGTNVAPSASGSGSNASPSATGTQTSASHSPSSAASPTLAASSFGLLGLLVAVFAL